MVSASGRWVEVIFGVLNNSLLTILVSYWSGKAGNQLKVAL